MKSDMAIEFHTHDSSKHFGNHCCSETLEETDNDSWNL
jgi:hypothetical protein